MNDVSLLPYQVPASQHLLDVVRRERVSVNASDTGTGKTFMALWLACQSRRPFVVICPKATIPNWTRLIGQFGLASSCLLVTNIEQIKTGKTQYLTRGAAKNTFIWNLPPDTVVFLDEAHICGGQTSQNAYILAYLKTVPGVHVHLMSATLADSPARFRAFGFLLDLHDFVHFTSWAYDHGCFTDEYGNLRLSRSPSLQASPMKKLHEALFPRHGVRLRIPEIEGFPINQMGLELVQFAGTAAFRKDVESYMATLRPDTVEWGAWADEKSNTKSGEPAIVQLLRDRQEAELLKLPYISSLIRDCVQEEGHSAVIFLNFKHSIRTLATLLSPDLHPVFITGDMKQADREAARNSFQDNTSHVIIATHGAGGTGIDLHDLKGRPRRSFISPCFHTVQFKQTLGRIHRAGGLSPSVQTILCMSGTAEGMVLKTLERKLQNLDLLNDGELTPEIDP